MSYFIIPKINNIIAVNPTVEENTSRDPSIHLSHSLFNYYYILSHFQHDFQGIIIEIISSFVKFPSFSWNLP